jgi:hypothetical protein
MNRMTSDLLLAPHLGEDAGGPDDQHQQHDECSGRRVLEPLGKVDEARVGFSTRPMIRPPAMAPGMLPKPPTTAAGKALRPMKPMLLWTKVIGARSTAAKAATPAEIAQDQRVDLRGRGCRCSTPRADSARTPAVAMPTRVRLKKK